MADTAVDAALDELAGRPGRGALEELAAGRMLTAQQTIDAWLQRPRARWTRRGPTSPQVALHARVAIATACRELLDEAARACGSRPFARGGELDRARRDLELFLLQHRLDPMLARAGAADAGAPREQRDDADDRRRLRGSLPRRPRSLGLRRARYERAKYDATLAACGPGPFAARSSSAARSACSARAAGAALPFADDDRRLRPPRSPPPAPAGRLAHVAGRSSAQIPEAIPPAAYDLVVASEILYYLSADELDRDARAAARACWSPAAGWSRCTGVRPAPSARSPRPRSTRSLRAQPWLHAGRERRTADYLLDVLERR